MIYTKIFIPNCLPTSGFPEQHFLQVLWLFGDAPLGWGTRILGKGEETKVFLTRRVQPVDAKHCLAVEHPEVAVVAGQQAGLAGTNHMVANNIPTGNREKVNLVGFSSPSAIM